MKIDDWTVHRTVEWIRLCRASDFDAADVEEDVEAVLRANGFCYALDDEARARFVRELWPVGLASEANEVARTVGDGSDPAPGWLVAALKEAEERIAAIVRQAEADDE